MASDDTDSPTDVEDLDDTALDAESGLDDTDDTDDTDDDTDGKSDGDADGSEPQSPAPLDELEAEELEMLTEDETNETMVVDEAAEMRAIRRAEIAMEAGDVDEAHSNEFVCSVCFLVKSRSQLAAKRKKVCLDCAS